MQKANALSTFWNASAACISDAERDGAGQIGRRDHQDRKHGGDMVSSRR